MKFPLTLSNSCARLGQENHYFLKKQTVPNLYLIIFKSFFKCFSSIFGFILFAILGLIALFPLKPAWASSVVQTEQVRAELVSFAPNGIKAGQKFWLGLKLSHQPHWHTYWKNPGDSGLPTQLSWDLPKEISVEPELWPTPKKLYVTNLTNYGYEGDTLLVTPVQVSQTAHFLSSSLEVKLHASWLVCKDECVPQEGDFRLSIPLKSSSAVDALIFESVIAQQPKAVSNTNQILEIKNSSLIGQIFNLPNIAQGKPVELFPELSEVIADPVSSQKSIKTSDLISLQMHPMRSTEPESLPIMMVVQTDEGPRSYEATFLIKGVWPSLKQALEEGAINDVALTPASNDLLKKSHSVETTFLIALLGALVGGVILNLMPCVLPVLAIKVLTLVTHSHQVNKYRRNSLGYAGGIIFCFLCLSALAIGLKNVGLELGWGFQLQSPFAIGCLCVLFTLIALNLIGLFEINLILPSRLISLHSEDPIWEGFFSGVLTVLVAAPCTAPFMGASLGWALIAPSWQGILIFVFLGIGMSFPIILISWIPSLAKLLPKPGQWMNTFRIFLAYPMLLTVIWLLWVFAQLVDLNQMTLLTIDLLTLSAAIYGATLSKTVKRFSLVFFVLIIIFTNWFWLTMDTGQAMAINSSPEFSQKSAQNSPRLNWEPWSPETANETLRLGRPVFIDFTAAWCITCQVNEHTTLENKDIKSLLSSKNVRLLRADWTKPNPLITKTLAKLGRSGVPVYLLLSPTKPQIMLSEVLKFQELKDALDPL